MNDLPEWVMNLVIDMLKHADEHPQYFAEYYPKYEMQRAATCGCEPLAHVPEDFKVAAAAVALDRARREVSA